MTLFIVSFVAGVLTVLAPCVLPLLPVILGGAVSDAGNRRRPVIIIVALSLSVFAFTLLLKGSTSLITASPAVWTYVSAGILFLFGLTLLFPETWARIVLKIPGHNAPDRWLSKGYGGSSSVWTDIVVGAALGPVFTTCSPTFFVILATVLPQSLALGLVDLAAYIVGLALVLLFVSWIGQRLVDRLEWASNPYGWFKKLLGVIFILLAVLIAFGLDKKIEAGILRSGFFDVTGLEQSIHLSLEGRSGESYPAVFTLPNGSTTPGLLPEHDGGTYVEIRDPAGFVNSDPFRLADLVGKKVILVDFVDYSCINCERTFPFLNEWYSKYKDQGLEIVAIHTPEFAFEKDISNVRMAAKMFNLKFPIVLDNDYATWNAYRNQYWPHKYLIDIRGNVIYDHIGEGNDAVTEAYIVQALNERKRALGEAGRVTMGTSTVPDYQVLAESPETYFGAERNEFFGNGTPGRTGSDTFTTPSTVTPNAFYLNGAWNIAREYAETAQAKAGVSYEFTAGNVYLIVQTADGQPATAQILLDGKPIPAIWQGKDVNDGILMVKESRLYHLYANPSLGRHRIDVIFSRAGVRVYTFTFG